MGLGGVLLVGWGLYFTRRRSRRAPRRDKSPGCGGCPRVRAGHGSPSRTLAPFFPACAFISSSLPEEGGRGVPEQCSPTIAAVEGGMHTEQGATPAEGLGGGLFSPPLRSMASPPLQLSAPLPTPPPPPHCPHLKQTHYSGFSSTPMSVLQCTVSVGASHWPLSATLYIYGLIELMTSLMK